MKKKMYALSIVDTECDNHFAPTIHKDIEKAIKEVVKDLKDHYQMNENPYMDKENFNDMIVEMKNDIRTYGYWNDDDTVYYIDKVEVPC